MISSEKLLISITIVHQRILWECQIDKFVWVQVRWSLWHCCFAAQFGHKQGLCLWPWTRFLRMGASAIALSLSTTFPKTWCFWMVGKPHWSLRVLTRETGLMHPISDWPMSLLSTVSKILKELVCCQLSFGNPQSAPNCQYGFRRQGQQRMPLCKTLWPFLRSHLCWH